MLIELGINTCSDNVGKADVITERCSVRRNRRPIELQQLTNKKYIYSHQILMAVFY